MLPEDMGRVQAISRIIRFTMRRNIEFFCAMRMPYAMQGPDVGFDLGPTESKSEDTQPDWASSPVHRVCPVQSFYAWK